MGLPVGHSPGRWPRLIGLAFAVPLVGALLYTVPLWIRALTPNWLVRDAITVFLDALLLGYGLTLFTVPPVLGLAVVGLLRSRRGTGRVRLARTALLCTSVLMTLGLVEAGSRLRLARLHRDPRIVVPRATSAVLPQRAGGPRETGRSGPLKVLVLGESSARGEPYDPKFSVGQLLAWQLERALPGRGVEVDMQAAAGAALEPMHQRLEALTYRPDVLLLFSGHNEFQTRFSASRVVPYYGGRGRQGPGPGIVERVLQNSWFCTLVLETREKQILTREIDPVVKRHLVDQPACGLIERRRLEVDFRRRLGAIAALCEEMGTVPLFIVPASNDRDYEPNRSVMTPDSTPEQRAQFALEFEQAASLARQDPERGVGPLRQLVARQPVFAEGHFRLARALERLGLWDEAREHYERARECDQFPMRCPEAFRDAYRAVARENSKVVLVDSPSVIAALAKHGVPGDREFHDAQHPTLPSYVALAQNALDQIAARSLLGWPAGRPAPRLDPEECARHFGIDQKVWAEVCSRTQVFYRVTTYLRYDPAERLRKFRALGEAAERIEAGQPPGSTGVPGLGARLAD